MDLQCVEHDGIIRQAKYEYEFFSVNHIDCGYYEARKRDNHTEGQDRGLQCNNGSDT